MNKYNCDLLKNLPVPEELIEKALMVPESAEKTPAVLPWYRRTRMIAAAASVVLVTTLGFSAFFLFRNKKPPVKATYEAVEPTAFATDAPTEPDDDPATEPTDSVEKATEPVAKPSERATEAATRTSSERSVTTVPTVPGDISATNEDQTAAPEQPSPTSAARQKSPKQSESTEKALPKPVIQPNEVMPVIPTEQALETTVPTVIPTDASHDPSPWVFLLAPTGDSGDPTASTSVPSGSMFAPPIYAHGSPDGLTGSGKVYCALYDVDGELMGGGELLSPERLTTVIWNRGGNLWLKYVVPQGILPDSGTYEIRLYNEDGREIARYTDYVVVPV